MYWIFTTVSLLLLFQSTSSLDIASDKETLRESLLQVDKFLDKVGQNIQKERNFLRTVARRQSSSTNTRQYDKGTSSNEFSALFSDGNLFNSAKRETKTDVDQTPFRVQKDDLKDETFNRDHPNFMRAFAELNGNKMNTASTKNLSYAIMELKQLVKNEVEVKPERNAAQATNDILKQVRDKLNRDKGNKNKQNTAKNGEIKTKGNTTKENKTRQTTKKVENTAKKTTNKKVEKKAVRDDDATANKGEKDEFDVFGEMDFPTHNNFPVSVSLVTVETTPEALKPDFVTETKNGYAADFLKTPTVSTLLNDVLLDPAEFGFTTTHKPITVYGDATKSLHLRPEHLTTSPEPNSFFKECKRQMKQYEVGVFSVAMMKLFDFAKFKDPKDLRRLSWGLARLFESLSMRGKLSDFGQPTYHALRSTTNQIGEMRPDELKSYGITLHNSMIHRREMFSKDINSILDYIDDLYIKEETNEVIGSLEALENFRNQKRVPYTELERFVVSIFAPFERLKESPRGVILKESLNRGLRNHFFGDNVYGEDEERRRSNNEEANANRRVKVKNKRGITNPKGKKNVSRRNIDLKEAQEFWKTPDPYGPSPIQERAFTILNNNAPFGVNPLPEQASPTNTNGHYGLDPMQEQKFTSLNKVAPLNNNNDIYSQRPMDQAITNNNNGQGPVQEQFTPNIDPVGQRQIQNKVVTPVNNQELIQNLIQRQAVSPNNVMTGSKGNVFERTKRTDAMSPIPPMAKTKAWTRPNINENKRIITINKEDPALEKDRILKMTSGKRHHKKHRHTHKRMKHKLAKILRIIRQYKPNYKKVKHKKHHRKHKKHKSKSKSHRNNGKIIRKSVISKELQDTESRPMHNKKRKKNTILRHESRKLKAIYSKEREGDRRWRHESKTPKPMHVKETEKDGRWHHASKKPNKENERDRRWRHEIVNYEDTKRVLAGDEIFNFRRNGNDEGNQKDATINVLRQLSSETDEEIPLKINLYKALALTTNHEDDRQRFHRNLDAVTLTDDDINPRKADLDAKNDETLLKNRLYEYFSRNIPAK